MYDYAIRFESDGEQGIAVFCRDLPELNSYGDNEEHALAEAVDAIESTLSIYVDQRRAIPAASAPEPGEHVVHLSAVTVAKVALWNTMMERGMRKADLCRLLNAKPPVVDRLVDFLHTSKMEQLELALAALNTAIRVSPPDRNWIDLPYGGAQAGFYVGRLADAFRERGVEEMPVGATKNNLDQVKPESVEYLLRTRYARNPNTMQAVQEVIESLVATDLFEHLPREAGVRPAAVLRLKKPEA